MAEIIKTKVRGVSQRNEDGSSRQAIIHKYLSEGDLLVLEREPDNEYDPNAIAVYCDSPDLDEYKKIGYLSRELAAKLAPLMDAGNSIDAEVLEITGEDKDTLGVNIQLTILTEEEVRARQERLSQMLKQPPKATIQPPKPKTSKSSKNIYITMILWFFFGIFGAHRWYVGRGSWLYTLTFGYLMFGWLLDLVLILTRQFKDRRGLPVWFV